MLGPELGLELRRARARAGLSQAALAARIGTTQSAVARAESGLVTPTIDFIERVVHQTRATLRVGSLVILPAERDAEDERAARVARALGDQGFDPWRRDPTEAERKSLRADGLTDGSTEG